MGIKIEIRRIYVSIIAGNRLLCADSHVGGQPLAPDNRSSTTAATVLLEDDISQFKYLGHSK